MKNGIELYKKFINGIVKIHKCVKAVWVQKGSFPNIDENIEINKLLKKLDENEKKVLSRLFQDIYDSGIHDVLAYINDKIECENLELIENGTKYVTNEFESMHYDFICRINDDEWPK